MEDQMNSGVNVSDVATKFGVKYQTLYRHKRLHMDTKVPAKNAKLAGLTTAFNPFLPLQDDIASDRERIALYQAAADRLLKNALQADDANGMDQAVKLACRVLDTGLQYIRAKGELTGELPRAGSGSVEVSAEKMVIVMPTGNPQATISPTLPTKLLG